MAENPVLSVPDVSGASSIPVSISEDATVYPNEKKAADANSQVDYKARKILVRRARKAKAMSPLHALCAWLVEHQIGTTALNVR
jgi:hypothetical protein